jgi:penicillin-binding protein 1C
MKLAILRLIAAVVLLPWMGLVLLAAGTRLPPELREVDSLGSIRLTSRGGRVLREVQRDDGTRAVWVSLKDVGPRVTRALLAAEDQRFRDHLGVDPLAIVRAAAVDLTKGHVVMGGSTLTMQLARTLRRHPRTFLGKLGEAALAVRIEWSLGKDAILEQYLNRASFGPNLRGIAAASRAYFDKSPGSLSVAEAALLVGIPRGPSLYDVTRHADLARRRRDRILDRMVSAGLVSREEGGRAKEEPILTQARHPSFGAPHLVAGLVSGALVGWQPGLADALSRPATEIETTIDRDLQRVAEVLVSSAAKDLAPQGIGAASVLVVDNATGDVLAYVGSPDFFDRDRLGQNDGARAERQPGSALKPFLYELAMERLGFDPSTRLDDVELHSQEGGQDYSPRDYDGIFRGPVRLREALGSSLNVPAVETVLELGVDPFLMRLRELGFRSLTKDARYYGPALALGDGEVTLLDLVRAYATLARHGVDRPLRFVSLVKRAGEGGGELALDPAPEHRVMPASFADLVTDILKDHDARRGSFGDRTVLDFPFEVAAKTGTSKGYRDNWAVGFTPSVTVGVWVGNMGGEPMANVSGITGAGPVFHAVLEAAMRGRAPEPLPVSSEGDAGFARVEVCALSGELAGPYCPHRLLEWRPRDAAEGRACTMHENVRLERTTRLRAGSSCPRNEVEEQVFERFPPELAAWAEAVGRPRAPVAWAPSCPRTAKDAVDDVGELSITYPLSGARFVIDPDRPRDAQELDVRVVAPSDVTTAALFVDGRQFATTGPPFEFKWPLSAGRHDLTAGALKRESRPVRVYVREAEGTP